MKRSCTLGLVLLVPCLARGQSLLWSVQGNPSVHGFGAGLASVGDVDGDGVPDIAASANIDSANPATGSTSILSGADSSSTLRYIPLAGAPLANGGDIDQDGVDDLMIEAGYFLRVYSLKTGAKIIEAQCLSGSTVGGIDSAGDFNGDGFLDLAAGDPNYGGLALMPSVRIFSGVGGGLLHQYLGPTNFGGRVRALGDSDADGFSDVGVAGQSGSFSVLHGGTQLETKHSTQGGSFQVRDLAALDDLDGDGRPEIAASMLSEIRVLSTATFLPLVVLGAGGNDGNGSELRSIGDQDGDSHRDLVDFSGIGASKVTLWSPATGTMLSTIGSVNNFGRWMDGAGDLDGDGIEDVILGAPTSAFGFVGVYSLTKLHCGEGISYGASCTAPSGTKLIALDDSGCLAPDGWFGIRLTATSGTLGSAFFLAGAAPASLAFANSPCNVLVDPTSAALIGPIPVTLPHFGPATTELTFLLPGTWPAPSSLYMQAIVNLGPVNYFTNGLQLSTP